MSSPKELIDAHTFSLPSQGSIYTQSTICLTDGTCKLIVASLNRKVFCCELSMTHCALPCGCVIVPQTKELQFTYIPSGAEIISIDAFNHSPVTDDFVIGITIIKSAETGSPGQFLNIYSDWEHGNDLELENLAQTCLSLELDYVPYQLTHCTVATTHAAAAGEEETVWLLAGSDRLIHTYRDDKIIHMYTECERYSGKVFPEFARQFPSIPLWTDIQVTGAGRRVSAVGCECGHLQLSVVNLADNNTLVRAWTSEMDGPLTSTRLFRRTVGDVRPPDFVKREYRDAVAGSKMKDDDDECPLQLAVTYSLGHSLVYDDVVNRGLDKECALPDSEKYDCVTCCCAADLALTGCKQVILGTYGQELLVYSFCRETDSWRLDWQRSLAAPILHIKYVDLTGDGVRELVVVTTQGAQVLQHDINDVKLVALDRIRRLAGKLGIEIKQTGEEEEEHSVVG